MKNSSGCYSDAIIFSVAIIFLNGNGENDSAKAKRHAGVFDWR